MKRNEIIETPDRLPGDCFRDNGGICRICELTARLTELEENCA